MEAKNIQNIINATYIFQFSMLTIRTGSIPAYIGLRQGTPCTIRYSTSKISKIMKKNGTGIFVVVVSGTGETVIS